MPLLQINAEPDALRLHNARHSFIPLIRRALRRPGPIVIMLHGYKFAPHHPVSCPHNHILSLDPNRCGWKVKSWPRALGFGEGQPDEGLAIAFGWPARGSIWQACLSADRTALQLAELLQILTDLAPNRPLHILAHSLGARVVLRALPVCGSIPLGRVILLNGAEFGETARTALDSPAGAGSEIINVTSRENDLFDFLLERLVRPPKSGDRCLSQNLPDRANTLTLQLDHPDTVAGLNSAGFSLGPDSYRVCHWSAYLRPGVFDVYKALIRHPERTQLSRLRASLPAAMEPRWSHLVGVTRGALRGGLAQSTEPDVTTRESQPVL